VLGAPEAAAALAAGFRPAGFEPDEAPVADGGEGTAAVFRAALGGEWRSATVHDPLGRPVEARFVLLPDGRAVVESAEAIGLARLGQNELDPMRASSLGLGELIAAALQEGASGLVIGLGDSATVDGGAGLRSVLDALPVETVAACDVSSPLLGERGAARVFGPQKGATPEQAAELEARLARDPVLAPYADLPGAGAAGGLGAALAALGARLVPGAELVLEAIGLRDRLPGAELVVTGEGTVDATSLAGKATGRIVQLCDDFAVRCVVFGGRLRVEIPGAETVALGGDPLRARADLEKLGERLAAEL
jgi:glycerate kinase